MSDLRSRIGELSVLGHDWDSHGANPLAPGVVLRALEIVELLGDGWHVYPRADGGVQFEHDNDDEIVVRPDGTYGLTLAGLSNDMAAAVLEARGG